MPRKRSNKPKPGFAEGYRTYDPSESGYGSAYEWRGNFRQRMGADEAREHVRKTKKTPREILGLVSTATWDEIRKQYRILAKKLHPDVNKSVSEETATREFQELQA